MISKHRIFLAEFLGTALLVLVGLSMVILMFGTGSPIITWIPDVGSRRLVTGFLFGCTGASIAISPIGKASGAHINPVVTLAFYLFLKIDIKTAWTYVSAQLSGAVIGCIPLLAWGTMGGSICYGCTIPGNSYSVNEALLGEIVTTFIMVSLLTVFLGFRPLRHYTPAIFPVLYALMVYFEAAISGTSTNPARSFGPAVVSSIWEHWWIYWAGPIAGAILSTLVMSFAAKRITEAKLYHFDNGTDLLFRNTKK
jgi:aquaporin Z